MITNFHVLKFTWYFRARTDRKGITVRTSQSPCILAVSLVLWIAAPQARAQTGARAFAVEQANEQAGFMIRVDVDRPDRVYHEGEAMTVSIVAEKDCHVYLLYYDAADQITCLFPNRYQQDRRIKARDEV